MEYSTGFGRSSERAIFVEQSYGIGTENALECQAPFDISQFSVAVAVRLVTARRVGDAKVMSCRSRLMVDYGNPIRSPQASGQGTMPMTELLLHHIVVAFTLVLALMVVAGVALGVFELLFRRKP